jgi:hypothetical protein
MKLANNRIWVIGYFISLLQLASCGSSEKKYQSEVYDKVNYSCGYSDSSDALGQIKLVSTIDKFTVLILEVNGVYSTIDSGRIKTNIYLRENKKYNFNDLKSLSNLLDEGSSVTARLLCFHHPDIVSQNTVNECSDVTQSSAVPDTLFCNSSNVEVLISQGKEPVKRIYSFTLSNALFQKSKINKKINFWKAQNIYFMGNTWN